MPAKTQNLKRVLDATENLYEAAIVIGRRARQINNEYYQKKRDHQILEELDGSFEDDFLGIEQEDLDNVGLAEVEENPISIAQRDFFEKRLDYYYESSRKK